MRRRALHMAATPCGLALAALIATIAGACGSFGEQSATPGGDAGADGDAGAGAAGDAAAHEDGPSDGGSDALFCPTHDAALCWSFDEGPSYLLGRGLAKEEIAGGSVALTSDVLTTPPHAARLTSASAGSVAGLYWAVSPVKTMRCEGDVVVDTAADTTLATIAQMPSTGAFTPLINATASGGMVTLELAIGASTKSLGSVPLKKAFHVALSVDAPGMLVTAEMSGGTGAQTSPAATTNTPTSFYFFVSIPGWSIVVDDLVCATR